MISDGTTPMPPAEHLKATETPEVPTVHCYNIQAMRLKGQKLMANYVKTIKNPPATPNKPTPLMLPAGEDWSVINQVTVEITLETGRANALICPKTGKSQEYLNLFKVSDKLKWRKGMFNDIGQLLQGLGTYRELILVFHL